VEHSNKTILFFDGDCGLCSRTVRILMRMDKDKRIQFAPLQGEVARQILPTNLRKNLSTVVLHLVQEGASQQLTHSDAALSAIIVTGSSWRYLAKMAISLPRAFRDTIYNWIAKNRDRFFKNNCPIPRTGLGDRLLP